MAEPLSEDLRKRLIDAVGKGSSRRAVAERFGV
ncbi:MAG: IS630 family transposase, partial [Hyphomicrobiaceae bacterium]